MIDTLLDRWAPFYTERERDDVLRALNYGRAVPEDFTWHDGIEEVDRRP